MIDSILRYANVQGVDGWVISSSCFVSSRLDLGSELNVFVIRFIESRLSKQRHHDGNPTGRVQSAERADFGPLPWPQTRILTASIVVNFLPPRDKYIHKDLRSPQSLYDCSLIVFLLTVSQYPIPCLTSIPSTRVSTESIMTTARIEDNSDCHREDDEDDDDERKETFLTSDESSGEDSEDDDECRNSSKSTVNTTAPLIDISRHFQERLKYSSSQDEEDDSDAEDDVDAQDVAVAVAAPLVSQEDSRDNNDSEEEQEDNNTDNEQENHTNSNKKQQELHSYCVKFDPTVVGVEISHHSDYPDRIRRRLWNSFAEIQTNAERNIAEFRADGWEWRNATEEADMVQQQKNGGSCSSMHNNNDNGTITSPTAALVHPASFKPVHHNNNKKRKMGKNKSRFRRRQRARHC